MSEVPAHLAELAATARAFLTGTGAERVVLLIDVGDGCEATMVDCGPDGALEITEAGESFTVAAEVPPGAAPRPLPELRAIPPTAISLDADSGDLEAPLGAVSALAHGVLALAGACGGRSVASVDFPTRDPELPLTIAAREGEPLVVAAGDRRFQLPPEALA